MEFILIKSNDGSFIKINFIKHIIDSVNNNYYTNCVYVVIEFKIGKFSGSINACLQTCEFKKFYEQLVKLYDNLTGEARFESPEGQLELSFKGNGRGQIELSGNLMDRPGLGHKLHLY